MCACTYRMQHLDEQCILVVKIENAFFFFFFFWMDCFLGELFIFFSFFLHTMQ